MSVSSPRSAVAASLYTTLEPGGIASKFEDAIVQKEPASPVYSEHSFSTCRVPVRWAVVLMLESSSRRKRKDPAQSR
jgi:hypothetical protein